MLEIFLKERGQVPYLRQAFGLLDSYILGELNFGDGGEQMGTKFLLQLYIRPRLSVIFQCSW